MMRRTRRISLDGAKLARVTIVLLLSGILFLFFVASELETFREHDAPSTTSIAKTDDTELLDAMAAISGENNLAQKDANRGDGPTNDIKWMFGKYHQMPDAAFCRGVLKLFIRNSFAAYEKVAFGMDEVHPLTGDGFNWYTSGTLAVTMVESLDTLVLAGLDEEAQKVIDFIGDKNRFDVTMITERVSFYEVTVRVLGGLLSGYHLTRNEVLLHRATELGDLLLETATDNGKRKVPRSHPFLHRTKRLKTSEWVAEHIGSEDPISILVLGAVQLEFRALSHFTGDLKYDKAARKWHKLVLEQCDKDTGRCPLGFDSDGFPITAATSTASPATRGDGFYKNLLKQFAMSKKKDVSFLSPWFKAVVAFHKDSAKEPYYIPDGKNQGDVIRLSTCSYAASLAHSFQLTALTEHKEMAIDLLMTCKALQHTKTGLPQEVMKVPRETKNEDSEQTNEDEQEDDGQLKEDQHYRLSAELFETLFYLHEAMNGEDLTYRRDAWSLLSRVYEHLWHPTLKTFLGAVDVSAVPVRRSNRMDPHWMSQSLKYLLLMFRERDEGREPGNVMDGVVLSTEGHIFPTILSSKR